MNAMKDRFEISLPDGWRTQLPKEALTTDVERMQFVLKLVRWNVDNKTGGPFAAAVFCNETNDLISIGVNRVVAQTCSLAHAEAVAIALAQQRMQTHDLSTVGSGRFDLFASGQPCVQCFGMTWWSGVTRLVIGARSSDIEEITEFREGPLPTEWRLELEKRNPLPDVEVIQDVCREEARHVLQHYVVTGGLNYSPGAR